MLVGAVPGMRPTNQVSSRRDFPANNRNSNPVAPVARIEPVTSPQPTAVERSHRIDAEEFYRMLDGVVIDDAGVFNERLLEWENFYNSIDRTAASEARRHTND